MASPFSARVMLVKVKIQLQFEHVSQPKSTTHAARKARL